MTDLAAFLAARLDEDEAGAARARSLRDKLDDPYRQIDQRVKDGAEYAWRETAADPDRVLREVAAKRAVAALVAEAWRRYQDELMPDGSPSYDDGALAEWRERWDALQPVLHLLGAIYSDHPDYDQGWAP